jgi:hypothetical protein
MDIKYREYLISKKWEGYKNAIHYIYNEECFICNSKEELQVHHKTYDRIYHEDLDDLVLVCSDCHECIHTKLFTKEEAYQYMLDGIYQDKLSNKVEEIAISL